MKKLSLKSKIIKNAAVYTCRKTKQSLIFGVRTTYSVLEELIYGLTCIPTKIGIVLGKIKSCISTITFAVFQGVKNLFCGIISFPKFLIKTFINISCRCGRLIIGAIVNTSKATQCILTKAESVILYPFKKIYHITKTALLKLCSAAKTGVHWTYGTLKSTTFKILSNIKMIFVSAGKLIYNVAISPFILVAYSARVIKNSFVNVFFGLATMGSKAATAIKNGTLGLFAALKQATFAVFQEGKNISYCILTANKNIIRRASSVIKNSINKIYLVAKAAAIKLAAKLFSFSLASANKAKNLTRVAAKSVKSAARSIKWPASSIKTVTASCQRRVLAVAKHPGAIFSLAFVALVFLGFKAYSKEMASINYSKEKLAEKRAEMLEKHKQHSILRLQDSDNAISKSASKRDLTSSKRMLKNTSDLQKFVDDFFSTHKVSEVMCSGSNCKMKVDNKIVDNHCILCKSPEIFMSEASDDYIVFADSSGNKYAKSIMSLLE